MPQSTHPATGHYVRIDSVQDNRTFTIKPPSADMASLDPDEDPGDASKARAIGRKRNGYGKALGDVVLPEGKTVSGLVESALTTGFQEAGYIVVKQGDPNFAAATPVNAQVVEFWAWLQPGFWSVTTHHKSELQLSGDVDALHGTRSVKTHVNESKQIMVSSDWQEIVEKRLVGDYSADEELAKRRVARKEGPFHLSVRMPERLAQRFKWRCGAHPHRDAQVSASLMRDGGHISAEQNVDIQYYLPLTRRVVRCLPHKHADVGRSLLATAFCVTSTLNNPLRAP